MKILPLILISIIYLIVLILFNFSLYKLITDKNFGHQYYLILIYFLCQLFSIFFCFISKKRVVIINDINPYIVNTDINANLSISDLSYTNISNNNIDNNSTISNLRNNSDSSISLASDNISSNESIDSNVSKIPFVGIKCVSFIFSGFLDFLSKLFIYNGIKYMNQDSILRCLIEIIIASFGSLIILGIEKFYYAILGLSIIIIYLILCIIIRKGKVDITGILLLLEGGLINSIQYLIQSRFFIKGEQFIYRIVSWEALYGSIFSFLTLIIASAISCPFEKRENISFIDNSNIFDYYSFCNGNKIEDNLIIFLSEIKNNILWFIFYLISCIFYTFIGIFITRYINVVYRVSLDTFRMLFFIILLIIYNK